MVVLAMVVSCILLGTGRMPSLRGNNTGRYIEKVSSKPWEDREVLMGLLGGFVVEERENSCPASRQLSSGKEWSLAVVIENSIALQLPWGLMKEDCGVTTYRLMTTLPWLGTS